MRNIFKKGAGDLTLVLLIAIVAMAFFLTIVPKKDPEHQPQPNQGTYTPITRAPQSDQESLQLQDLGFTHTDPPKPTFDCNEKGIIGSAEPNILFAMNPAPGTPVGAEDTLTLFYNDEWPLTLGYGNISPNNSESHISGNQIIVGDETKKDSNGFPFFPALFLTDITTNPNDKSGDAENGGIPHKPTEIWGKWISAGSDPTNIEPNNSILPSGAPKFPEVGNIKYADGARRGREEANGAAIMWSVQNLGLTPGHTYRAEFIIHDGDREGDIGQGCTTIKL